MKEFIFLGKFLEFMSIEWRAIVGDYCLWYSISGHGGLDFSDDVNTSFLCQSINLKKIGVVVNTNDVRSSIQFEQITSYCLPRSVRDVIWDHWFSLLLVSEFRTSTATSYMQFNVLTHPWPENRFSGTSLTPLDANVA